MLEIIYTGTVNYGYVKRLFDYGIFSTECNEFIKSLLFSITQLCNVFIIYFKWDTKMLLIILYKMLFWSRLVFVFQVD